MKLCLFSLPPFLPGHIGGLCPSAEGHPIRHPLSKQLLWLPSLIPGPSLCYKSQCSYYPLLVSLSPASTLVNCHFIIFLYLNVPI